MLKEGLTFTSKTTVTDALTAKVLGSGDMDVLATPAMVALMENAAMMAVAPELPEGMTTVGGHIETSHLRPSKVGAEIEAKAVLEKIDGKKLFFVVEAMQDGNVIGQGKHLRFIVDRDKFLSRL